MKKIITIILSVFVAISVTNCHDYNEIGTSETSDNHLSAKINLTNNPLNPIQIDTVIAYDYGKYIEMFIPTDYTAVIRSFKNPFFNDEIVDSFIESDKDEENTSKEIFLNNFKLKSEVFTKSDNEGTGITSVFGSVVSFNVSDKIGVKSSEENTSFYLPDVIRIESPKIEREEDEYPLCDYSNFVVRWNIDANNENGVVIMVTWNGTTVVGESYPDTYVRRIDVVPDNGEVTINPQMFDDIPDTAICSLIVGRGNTEISQEDGDSYKFIGESHEVIPFILVRNII